MTSGPRHDGRASPLEDCQMAVWLSNLRTVIQNHDSTRSNAELVLRIVTGLRLTCHGYGQTGQLQRNKVVAGRLLIARPVTSCQGASKGVTTTN